MRVFRHARPQSQLPSFRIARNASSWARKNCVRWPMVAGRSCHTRCSIDTGAHSTFSEISLPTTPKSISNHRSSAISSEFKLRVSDGDKKTIVTTVGSGKDDNGNYVKLKNQIGTAYSVSDGTTVRYPNDQVKDMMSRSKKMLKTRQVRRSTTSSGRTVATATTWTRSYRSISTALGTSTSAG